MSTLPPERQVSRDVPVVTADGATAAAYKDPNSPESIMRRAKTAEVQAAVDSKYDNNTSPYEGFKTSDISSMIFTDTMSYGFIRPLIPYFSLIQGVLFILLSFFIVSAVKQTKSFRIRIRWVGLWVLVAFLLLAYNRNK